MHLKLKERKLLLCLDRDGRQSARSIASETKMRKENVRYLKQKLIRTGVLTRTYIVLNTVSLGFLHFNALLRFRNITGAVKERFLAFCKSHTRVIWCVSCYGAWDFSVSFLAKNLQEYDEFMRELLQRYGSDLHEHVVSLLVDSPTYNRSYLGTDKARDEFVYRSGTVVEIDALEHNLLCLLSANGDLSLMDIARRLGTSIEIVRHRVRKLKQNGVIQGFRAGINIEKLGRTYFKILFTVNTLTPQQELAMRETCLQHPDIVAFIKYIGPIPLQIEVEIEPDRIYEVIELFRNRFPDTIKTYEVIRLHEEKLNYYPLPRISRS